MEIRAVRGMNDLYGKEMQEWHYVEEKLRKIFRTFGYEEIRTPVLEKIEVFKGAVGDDTDIVEKQMYAIEKENETLVLRPEGTASFIRAVLEHQLHRTGGAQRFYYYLPMFRHERPQKGRLRQFHQFGAEIINDPTPEADSEIIALLNEVYRTFGISEYTVRINSVGCQDCRPVYKEKLKEYFRPHLATLCEQCQKRFERAPMRILDCKKEGCKKLAAGAPVITDSLCVVCKTHHDQLKVRLKQAEIPFQDDPTIVRGLDYYSRTAFEFTSPLLGAQDALGGGGRYDGISARFGEPPFPAVGFGLGMERLMLALQEKKLLAEIKSSTQVYLAPIGEAAFDYLFAFGMKLRKLGIAVETSYDKDKGLKWHMKQANRVNAQYTLILGEEELKGSFALLKDMATGNQEQISLSELQKTIERKMLP